MRFHLIDALRGLAAFWVVLFHAYEGGHLTQLAERIPDLLVTAVFRLGDTGVPIFFVISGFVIAHSLSRDYVDGSYVAKFTLRRSIRLDPPYWGSILLMAMMAWLSAYVQGEAFIWPDFGDLLAHLFYVQGILEIPHFNIIYWTLCLEIQFYLIFCMLIYLTQRLERYYRHAFIMIFSIVAFVSLLWPTQILVENVYTGLFFPWWHAFLVGVFAYWSWKNKIPSYFFYIYVLIVLGASIVNVSVFSIAAAITALVVHECAKYNQITFANWRWIQFLGIISYSLYLTHNPITGASYFLIYKILGRSLITESFALIASTAICIIFAYIFWWLFERWSIKLSKKIHLHRGEKHVSQ